MKPVSRQTLKFVATYLAIMAVGNFVWEIAHLPLYTIWLEDNLIVKAYAVSHCTAGDVLIAIVSLLLAIAVFGRGWPQTHYWSVAGVAIALGVSYTVFSEWLNISVRGSWAYRDIMPVVPPFETGLTPLLQWLVLPVITFCLLQPRRGLLFRTNADAITKKSKTE